MNRFYYDLHIHSCLSPCADDDSTPANIVGMAVLNGLQIVALTDHNTIGNCRVFMEAAQEMGIVPIPGMELTTSEDIHVVCLFPDLDSAERFDQFVSEARIRIKNKPAIFGHQYLVDADDNVIREEEDLLINATSLSLNAAYDLCFTCGGVCYPAHIDRTSNGIISTLGAFPDDPVYTSYEMHDQNLFDQYRCDYPLLENKRCVYSSDAHELGAIAEAENYVDMEVDCSSPILVARSLIELLRGEIG